MKNRLSSKPIRFAIIALASGHLASAGLHAALLAYDDFAYETGSTLITAGNGNGGTGWFGKWSGGGIATVESSATAITYSSAGITYGGGNSMSISGSTGTQNAATRAFSETTISNGSDIFFSFIVSVTGGTAGQAISASSFISVSLLDSGFSTASDNGIILNGSFLGVRVANTTKSTTDTLLYGKTYLVVGRFSGWNETTKTYQQTSVWLNPVSTDFTDTASGTVVATTGYASISVATSTGTGSDGYRGVTLRTNALGTNVYLFDDLRIGTTWDDVVIPNIPEPASTTAALTIAALAATSALVHRRHR
ncbi:MAG: cell wall anchor protein [Opitutaceae bacterium]|jgi:hypothetical protein|nr:cell wall anchor protein [Opitutaceae bacterium]